MATHKNKSVFNDLKISRRGFGKITALGAGSLMLPSCKPILSGKLTSTDTHVSGYPTVVAVEHFGKLLEERTNGKLALEMYAGGQLGSELDTLEITIFGGLDFNRVNMAPLNTIEPTTIVPSLPFLFESTEHMRTSMDGPIGDEILASLEQHGLIGLCFFDSGARSFYNTRGPITKPEDMKGLKIRVPGSDLYVAMVKSLGADATPMPMAEVYQSLTQGVIDGAENNWPSFESGRHFEAAPFISLTQHLLTPEVFVMSKISWDKLNKNEQEILRKSAKEAVVFMRGLWDAQVEKSRKLVLDAGIKMNEVDPAPFTAAMKNVWDSFITNDKQRRLVDGILALREKK